MRVTERERWSRMERQQGLQKEKDGLGWRDNEGYRKRKMV